MTHVRYSCMHLVYACVCNVVGETTSYVEFVAAVMTIRMTT